VATKEANDHAVAEARARRQAKRDAEYAKRNAEAAARKLEWERNRNKGHTRARHNARIILPARDGCVFVVSDQHYYAGFPPSRAHVASLVLGLKLKPWAIISNGDAIDGASISRWPVSSFTEMKGRPTISVELEETTARLRDYEKIKSAQYRIWNLGNHDARFETRLAEKVPEYAGVNGFTLKERFPDWLPAWRTDIAVAPDAVPLVVVKHRFKGGLHAGQNNALWTGVSTVTGHDHMLRAYPITNVHGLMWGVHAGTMAPIDSPGFTHYTEDNVQNWQEGFAILHFKDGKFIGPELVHVTQDGRVLFRGECVEC